MLPRPRIVTRHGSSTRRQGHQLGGLQVRHQNEVQGGVEIKSIYGSNL